MGRKIRDRADAKRCLAAWEASGESLAAWARSHDIDGRSLHCWKLNLREVSHDAPAGFLELLGAVGETVDPRRGRGARYTVRFDELEVEVGDDFDDHTLMRLLRVVAGC